MPSFTLARAQRFELASKASGRSYDISLARPLPMAGTGEAPSDCPIVFVLDSPMTFGTAVDASAFRATIGQLTPSVIVGIGYDADFMAMTRLRVPDMTPPTPAGTHADMAPMIGTDFGGADAFLDFILGELVEAVRARAPEASATRRVLFGHSLAGFFTIHTLMTRPEAFETFAASSPSLWWNDFDILKQRSDFDDRLKAAGVSPRVLITVGAMEQDEPKMAPPGMDLDAVQDLVRRCRMVDAAREFAASLQDAALDKVDFVNFVDEDHGSVVQAAVGRAVTFALKPQ